MLTDSKRYNMQQNESTTTSSLAISASMRSTPSKLKKLLDHWAWDFYAFTFATLFAIFGLSCFVSVVRQCTQSSRRRNVHGRFTTVQLFVAATLKVVALLWIPVTLHEASMEIFAVGLLVDCFSMALILSAFSILLLILLETTKTSLAAPRLQNIWVLLAITALLASVMLTFNLLVLYADREFWHFVSYVAIVIWGTLVCVGYVVAGHRMRKNLRSSRQIGKPSRERRLKNVTILVFLAPGITAATLILNICLAASDFGILGHLKISAKTIWTRYAIMFLLKCCELTIVVLIFANVVRTKAGRGSVDDAPSVQLGTFTDERPLEEKREDGVPSSKMHNSTKSTENSKNIAATAEIQP